MSLQGSLFCVLFGVLLWCSLTGKSSAQETAFFYGPKLPRELLHVYGRVVVEPGHGFDPKAQAASGTELVAYLSVNEIADTSPMQKRIAPAWVVGRNAGWQSAIMDLASAGFQQFFLKERFDPLWQQGYRSFFLDTLDSYMSLSDARQRERQRQGMVTLLRAMHARHPEARFVLNRGFEVIDQVHALVHGVVAESLFDGFDASRARYVRVADKDRAWLVAQLERVQKLYKLPVTVIDYRPPNERKEALATARRIAALGFQAWVTDAALQGVGTSAVQVLPRRALLLVNDGATGENASDAVRYLAPVLEYLGYVPEPHDVRVAMPEAIAGTVRAVVVWLQGSQLSPQYVAFLEAQRAQGVPLVFFGSPRIPFDAPLARALGLEQSAAPTGALTPALAVYHDAAIARGEAAPVPNPLELAPMRLAGPSVVAHLSIDLGQGQRAQVVASAPWGGLASSHFMAVRGLSGERAWAIDPFNFFERALTGPEMPRPDFTTEQGGRLALFTLRAAGLGETSQHVGRPHVRRLFAKLAAQYPVPYTIDLQPSEQNRVSTEDVAAAKLLGMRNATRASPRASNTRLRTQDSLTELTSLTLSGAEPALPLAGDYQYIPEGISEAYPYRALLETLRRTDLPRRLTPISLDYHASSLATPGGMETIEALYLSIMTAGARPISYADFAARVLAFREQVLTRDAHGGWAVYGGRALLTLRVPLTMGAIDLKRSRGIARVDVLPQGRYVSFLPEGPRSLAFLGKDAGLAQDARVGTRGTSGQARDP